MDTQDDLPTPEADAPAAAAPAADAAKPHVITRRSVVSWVLYDLANTIFSMNILSLYFSLYVAEQLTESNPDAVFSRTTAVSYAVIFVLSPVLGAMTDRAPRRIPFLVAATFVCVLATAYLGYFGLGVSLVLFVVANIAYQAGLQFYDAMLPDVSTEENRGRVGGIGVGIGFFGSYLGVGAGLVLIEICGADFRDIFAVTAVIFLLFAWPAFVFVRERGNPQKQRFSLSMVPEAVRQVKETFHASKKYPGLLRFLIGRVFYTDAVNTVVMMMGLYVTGLAERTGLPKSDGQHAVQLIMLIGITFAIGGGFLWGWVVDRIGPKRTLNIVLGVWVATFGATAIVGFLSLPLWVMYVLAVPVGLAMGGTQAADRPYMLRLTPPNKVGEFYGLYGMVGRFSAVTGPIVWGVVVGGVFATVPAIGQPIGITILMGFVILGYFILRPVSDAPRDWDALAREQSVSAESVVE